ncbi:DUF4926 domain-containing protein [Ferrovum myxofaciens]|jgi:hypothetical protein|uniref:DUF4926 domain-containing protein n=2 Tax=root TaxID=1 RepID=A0A8F3DSG3_9PROT|nr:DUF4926 domain-containing protein [Ferrovum myxofaciens]KXW58500.1 hypothetical protein FEMY_08990 [Ferrovum myxofaciens]MBU6994553.1 DUF4926 domain-containing protein [Ferrovum myxofaciens]QKE38418.1 MAG: DUF4926 domain-containing protein [Ferrovum myxofaciens]QWY73601.1 MAG: DUF4926 domain-containing protein [Ferrovum myxofaciens]QWY76355.1 MAG: DUF4926 domain-containing protein [Ferrovum myxofaciens]
MKLLDVVATLEDVPAAHLAKGQVGTIVDELSDEVVLVEFADLNGVAYAVEPISVGKLIELRHAPAMAA